MSKINLDESRKEKIFQEWKSLVNQPEPKQDDEFTFQELLSITDTTRHVLEQTLKANLKSGVVTRRYVLYEKRRIYVYKIKLPHL